MKKKILLFLLITISMISYAQDLKIQETFWGQTFGTKQNAMFEEFSKRGYSPTKSQLSIGGSDVNLGGIKWKQTNCHYFKDQLFSVCLYNSFSTNEEAIVEYNRTKERLREKYQQPKVGIKDSNEESIWDDNINCIILNINKNYFEDYDKTVYYLNLIYFNQNLRDAWYQSLQDEL